VGESLGAREGFALSGVALVAIAAMNWRAVFGRLKLGLPASTNEGRAESAS
jgi:hypothetical protein